MKTIFVALSKALFGVCVAFGTAGIAQADTLLLVSLHCVDTEDNLAEDEAVLVVDGQTVYGTKGASCPKIRAGETVALNRQMIVTPGQSSVSLLDYDFPDPTDHLGTQVVPSRYGRHTLVFQGSNFSYTLDVILQP